MVISYSIILKELKSVSTQALSMAVPDSVWPDTHNAVRALKLQDGQRHFEGFQHFSPCRKSVALPSSNGRCSGWFWTRRFYPLLRTQRGATTTRSGHCWAHCLAFNDNRSWTETLCVARDSPMQMPWRRQPSCSLVVFEATLFLPLLVLVLHLPPSAGPETWWKTVGFP